jgi:molybdenum cofactor biosynthesis enzyme MoaA
MDITLIETMPMGGSMPTAQSSTALSLVRAGLSKHYTLEPTDEYATPARYVRVKETTAHRLSRP